MPACAIAATPSAASHSRWSAESARWRAASAAPPWSESCSACSFTGSPSLAAAANTRSDLRGREGDRLAERVHRIGEPLAGERRKHLLRHEIDVGIGTARELRRHRVRPEIGRAHGAPRLAPEAARHAQHPRLRLEVEPVARLDLEGRRPVGAERIEARAALREQRFLVRGSRRPHGGGDAAALPRDLLVARALAPPLELRVAVAGVNEVRVAVDEAGRDERAPEVDLARGVASRQVRVGARPRRSCRPGSRSLRESTRPHPVSPASVASRARRSTRSMSAQRPSMGRLRPALRAVSIASG